MRKGIHWGNRSEFESKNERTQRLLRQMPIRQISPSENTRGDLTTP